LGNQTDTCFVDLSRTVLPTTLSVSLDDIELICTQLTNAELTAIGGNVSTNYTWSPSGLILAGQNTATATVALPADTATVSLFASDANGCTATASSFINIINITPPLDILASRDTVFVGDTLQLIATNNPAYSYTWQQNPTLQGNTIYNPIVQPTGGTTTTYTLTITDANGCINVDSIIVFTQNSLCGEPYIFVPNVFTPDGDGLNDAFFVRGANLTDFYLTVYNRWGELIFETNDQSRGWDGTFKGKTLAPDVFGYYLRCRCDDGTPYFKKGNVTIIK
jgi:gliding motility-associated-like protein